MSLVVATTLNKAGLDITKKGERSYGTMELHPKYIQKKCTGYITFTFYYIPSVLLKYLTIIKCHFF